MPISIPVHQLEQGMCLASNITNRFSVLLPHGHILSAGDIESLNRRLPAKMVQVIDPLLDQLVEFGDNSQDHNVSLEVRRNISSVTQKVSNVIRSGAALNPDNIAGMQKTIEEMIRFLQKNPVTSAIIDQSGDWNDYLQEHSANVFYLSLVIGNTIRNFIKRERERFSAARKIRDAMNLSQLATAAMLHDIGMVPLERMYNKPGSLTSEEIELVKAHPQKGAELLPDKIGPMTRLVVRCHHENHNGSGYPQGLTGDQTAIFARIVRVADAYSAATARTTYKKAKSSVRALYEMLYGDYKQFYDPMVLKVFTGIIQPFPIGARLKLQTGRFAVATKHNPKKPFAPEVLIAFDEQGESLPEEEFEGPFFLDERDDIKVVSFEDEDISYINEITEEDPACEPAEESAEEQALAYSEMFDLAFP